MVCLEGKTFDALKKVLLAGDLDQYSPWNWLVHKLIKFMHQFYSHPYLPFDADCLSPCVPDHRDAYGIWFDKIYQALSREFHDATHELVLRVCLNPPTADVASIIYNATSLTNQKAFLAHLEQQVSYIEEEAENVSPLPVNPADEMGGEMEVGEDDDSLPPLIPFKHWMKDGSGIWKPMPLGHQTSSGFIPLPAAAPTAPPAFPASTILSAGNNFWSSTSYGLSVPINTVISSKSIISKPVVKETEEKTGGLYSQLFDSSLEPWNSGSPAAAALPTPPATLFDHRIHGKFKSYI